MRCRFPFDLSLFHLFGTRVSRVPLTCRRVQAGAMAQSTLLDTELRYVAADSSEVATTVRDAAMTTLSTARPVRRVGSYAGQRHYSGLFWSATRADTCRTRVAWNWIDCGWPTSTRR